MMQTLLFDLVQAQPQHGNQSKFHGGGEYGKNLFRFLVSVWPKLASKTTLVVTYNPDSFLDEDLLKLFKKHSFITTEFVHDLADWEKIIKTYDQPTTTVFYPLAIGFLEKLPYRWELAQVVAVLHGLRLLELPSDPYEHWYYPNQPTKKLRALISQYISPKWWERRVTPKYVHLIKALKPTDIILTDSIFSRNSIELFFHAYLNNRRLQIVPPLAEHSDASLHDGLSDQVKDLSQERFFFSVNANRFVKNVFRVLEAIDRFDLLERLKVTYVVVGVTPALQKMITNKYPKLRKHLRLLGYVTNEEREFLYKNAELFVHMSLNEGYGLVLLESLRYGGTVLTSYATSLPEVGGDAVYYANPYNIVDIGNNLWQILHYPDQYQSKALREKRQAWYQHMTDQSKKAWLDFFKELA